MLDQKWSVGLPQSFEPLVIFYENWTKNSKSRSTWLRNPLMVPFFGIPDILFKGHIAILATFLYGSSWFGLGKMTPKYHDSIPSPLRDIARKVSKIDPRVIFFHWELAKVPCWGGNIANNYVVNVSQMSFQAESTKISPRTNF